MGRIDAEAVAAAAIAATQGQVAANQAGAADAEAAAANWRKWVDRTWLLGGVATYACFVARAPIEGWPEWWMCMFWGILGAALVRGVFRKGILGLSLWVGILTGITSFLSWKMWGGFGIWGLIAGVWLVAWVVSVFLKMAEKSAKKRVEARSAEAARWAVQAATLAIRQTEAGGKAAPADSPPT